MINFGSKIVHFSMVQWTKMVHLKVSNLSRIRFCGKNVGDLNR